MTRDMVVIYFSRLGAPLQAHERAAITAVARAAAGRLMAMGPVRAKPPLATGGRAQRVLTAVAQMDALLERLEPDRLASYGLVLEPDLHQLRTLSIGQITVDSLTTTYYGTQR